MPARSMAETDWLAALRRATAAQRELLAAERTIAGRTEYEGVGEGGDRALVLDRRSEDIVFAELERMAAAGASFRAVSEERGEVDFGDDPEGRWVVIDPIDGSLNLRRTIPTCALSVAVASGPTLADVEFAYVYDFGAQEEFVARRGQGARVNGRPLTATGPGHGLEVVGIESAEPGAIAPAIAALKGKAWRVRSIGAIAVTMAYVAGGRLDAMLSVRGARSVDVAAAQLLVREAGGVVEFENTALDEATLDIDARYRVAAALDEEMLATVVAAQRLAEDPGR
ncbi:MAG TPA: inositol monophosphatase family protein [Solirubrobacterales bacterium]